MLHLENRTGKDHGSEFRFQAPTAVSWDEWVQGVVDGIVTADKALAYVNHGADLKCRTAGKGSVNAKDKAGVMAAWANDDPVAMLAAQAECTDPKTGIVNPVAWDRRIVQRFYEMADE